MRRNFQKRFRFLMKLLDEFQREFLETPSMELLQISWINLSLGRIPLKFTNKKYNKLLKLEKNIPKPKYDSTLFSFSAREETRIN